MHKSLRSTINQLREENSEAGLIRLEEALTAAQSMKEHCYDAELYRLQGKLLLASGANAAEAEIEAEAKFQRAIEVSRRQQAKSLELRATVSLAKLWQSRGKQAEARRMLTEIAGWFSEGFGTVDLLEAKAILEALL